MFFDLFAIENEKTENESENVQKLLKGIRLSGLWYIAFQAEEEPESAHNEFQLKRGYVTVQKEFNKHLSVRVTQDIAVDHEGDGEGDIEIRLEYGFLQYRLNDFSIFTAPSFEFGLVHRPWLDFEEKINSYRLQGTMFLERNDIIKSADFGFTFTTLIGGEMSKKHDIDSPGRYGSISFGIYNGGGYEDLERNNNKLIEGRLSLRPFPDKIPGLQLSYLGAYGKGNTNVSPDLSYNAGMLSWEQRAIAFSALYYTGTGNRSGNAINDSGESISQNGYSVFAEIAVAKTPLKAIGRFDNFDTELSQSWHKRSYIFGVAYYFMPKSLILVDYDHTETNGNPVKKANIFEVVLQFSY